jgi:hypothetical protein
MSNCSRLFFFSKREVRQKHLEVYGLFGLLISAFGVSVAFSHEGFAAQIADAMAPYVPSEPGKLIRTTDTHYNASNQLVVSAELSLMSGIWVDVSCYPSNMPGENRESALSCAFVEGGKRQYLRVVADHPNRDLTIPGQDTIPVSAWKMMD